MFLLGEPLIFFATKWVVFPVSRIRGGVGVGGAREAHMDLTESFDSTKKKTESLRRASHKLQSVKRIEFPVTTVGFIVRLSSLISIHHF